MSSPNDESPPPFPTGPLDGRFAPSPSAPLHVGNLRTAIIAWLAARSTGGRFLVRIEDLDRGRSRESIAAGQLSDLRAIGIDWDEEPLRQSERDEIYADALTKLELLGLTYPCWCTRGELAATAPHGAQQHYPGTCRDLSAGERAERDESGRTPAIRAKLSATPVTWTDGALGEQSGIAYDPIIRRADGDFAYNLAVVVDDADQRITEVVRGDDLAESVPTQAALCDALGLPRPAWTHVELVVGGDGERLAKRHGAITLSDWRASGRTAEELVAAMATSLGLVGQGESASLDTLVDHFSRERLPKDPWVFHAP